MDKKLKRLEKLGVVTRHDIDQIGIPKSQLYKLIEEGKIERLAYGFYYVTGTNALEPEETDFVVACKRFGNKAVVGGLSALAFYNLIEEIPHQVWVLVPNIKQTSNKFYRLIRTKHISSEGIIEHNHYKITTVERTLIDALLYSSKIGIDTAIAAIIKAVNNKQTSLNKISSLATKMRKTEILKKYWLTITGALSV